MVLGLALHAAVFIKYCIGNNLTSVREGVYNQTDHLLIYAMWLCSYSGKPDHPLSPSSSFGGSFRFKRTGKKSAERLGSSFPPTLQDVDISVTTIIFVCCTNILFEHFCEQNQQC